MEIHPGGANLNEPELVELANSSTLTNLHTLDLTNQHFVDDSFIEKFAINVTFSRLINLRLDGTKVTEQSIDLIRASKELGSIRDLPQISGRYQIPSSTIRVYVKDTKVKTLPKEPPILKGFHIEYFPPIGRHYWEPVDHGVKILEIENW